MYRGLPSSFRAENSPIVGGIELLIPYLLRIYGEPFVLWRLDHVLIRCGVDGWPAEMEGRQQRDLSTIGKAPEHEGYFSSGFRNLTMP